MVRSFMTAAVLALGVSSAAAQDRVRLEVYSTLEVENINDFKKSFEAENPDIEIVWNRDSTGVVTARILAEQSVQRADAIWGLAVTSMLLLDKRGLLEPYAPKNLAAIKPAFRDPANPPAWVGMEAWVATVCFNTVEAAKLGLAKPVSWYDLTEPRFKGNSPCRTRRHRAPATSMSRPGSRCSARPRPGSSWTGCTTTSRSTSIPARGPAAWPHRASIRPASPTSWPPPALARRVRRSRG